jgi:flagellar assembly factor FliW
MGVIGTMGRQVIINLKAPYIPNMTGGAVMMLVITTSSYSTKDQRRVTSPTISRRIRIRRRTMVSCLHLREG